MPVAEYGLYNLRLYSDCTVVTERAVLISQGVIADVVSDTGHIVDVRDGRNLEGAILAPGLIDLCCRLVQGSASSLEQIKAFRLASPSWAVTDIAIIATPGVALSLLKNTGSEALSGGEGAGVLGIRVDCGADAQANIRELTELLTHFGTRIIDVRCLLTDQDCAILASTVREFGGRLCLELPEDYLDHDLWSRLAEEPISCISVHIKSIETIPAISEWIEVRMPNCHEMDLRPLVNLRSDLSSKLLIGNHRRRQSAVALDAWARHRQEMYYLRDGTFEFMPLCNAAFYMNRQWGIPMHRILATATHNAAAYTGQAHDLGRIQPGYAAHLSILDRKLKALDALV